MGRVATRQRCHFLFLFCVDINYGSSLTTVFSMLPLALGIGGGAEMLQLLAVTLARISHQAAVKYYMTVNYGKNVPF